jgi:hypothetical protein
MNAQPLLLGLPFGLAPLGFGAWQIRQEFAPRRWSPAPGKILSCKIDEDQNGFTPVIEYEFQRNGQICKSSRRRLRQYTFGQRADAEAVIARYAVGSNVTVMVDPANAQRSVLEYGVTPLSWAPIVLGLIFISLSLLPLVLK